MATMRRFDRPGVTTLAEHGDEDSSSHGAKGGGRLSTGHGLAGLLPAHDAAAAATFLREVVVPHYRRAGWPMRRVLTDGGPEFRPRSHSGRAGLGRGGTVMSWQPLWDGKVSTPFRVWTP